MVQPVKTAARLMVAAALLAAWMLAIAWSLTQATQAFADPPPSTTPTPGPVVNTGGGTGGADPGSSCSTRLGLRSQPTPPSALFIWSQSGDSGWPFGYPGSPPWTPISGPPNVGCSR